MKIVEVRKGRRELVPWLGSVHISVLEMLTTQTVTESRVMAVSPLPAVVVVNPVTQLNEHCEVASLGAPSQMIKKSNCTYPKYCSLALVMPHQQLCQQVFWLGQHWSTAMHQDVPTAPWKQLKRW